MSEDLKALRAQRKQLRRFFTLTAKLVESSLTAQPVDLEKVNVEFAKLADKAERLFAMDRQINEILFTDEKLCSDDDNVGKEFQGVEEYRETWVTITSMRELLLEKTRQLPVPDHTVVSNSSDKLRFKLPKLEIRKFDVQPRTWIAFWAAFKKIDESGDLEPEDKFQVLLQMTKEGTAARMLLDKFPPSAENYQKALDSLKQRFGRDELLIEVYVRDLLGLVIGQAKGSAGSSDIRELVENLEAKLMGLESLGLTAERFACLLLPLTESTLPEPVIREWERTKSLTSITGSEASFTDDAAKLMGQLREFLKKVVVSDERVELVRAGFMAPKTPTVALDNVKVGGKKPPQEQKVATASDLVSMDEPRETKQKCVFCTLPHPSEYCFEAREMDHDSKIQLLKENKQCFKCLKRFHGLRRCKGTVRCLVCSKGHCTSMCPGAKKIEKESCDSTAPAEEEKNLSNTNCVPVLMQTLQVQVNSVVGPKTARVLIDTGSQRSYITRELAEKMDYKPLREEKVVHALFGGSTTDVVTHACYKVRLQRLKGKYACNFDVLDSEKICNTIPAVPKGPWMDELRLKKIPVSDTTEGPIDVLVGSDVAGKLFTGRREVLSCGLVAMETCLGWTVMGRIRSEESNYMLNVTTLCTVDFSPSELWELDAIGIKDPADIATEEEARTVAREHFLNTVKTLEDGRYEVCLPWLTGHPPLPRGFQMAASRLESTVRRLRSDGLFEAYDGVFNEWLAEGIIEEVPFENWDKGHYLPHRAVLKEWSTTRIRPVFDASAHEKGKPNLNQCLEKGDNLIEKIPSILLRFRLKEIGLIADIRKAFLMISVNEADRDFLRFLWTDEQGKMKIFRHKRVVFGVTSSPYLLGAVIELLLDRCAEKAAAVGDDPCTLDVIEQLRKSLYVDNCVTSVSTLEERENFVEKAKSVFLEACFDLRGWEWSDASFPCSTITPVLGVMWDRKGDVLKVNPPELENFEDEVTRRSVLSASQRLFDPLGTCAPTSLIPRRIIQESWIDGGTWDTPLSEKGKNAFLHWCSEVSALKEIEMPRWVKASVSPSTVTLHIFCDASQYAYATVCYLRVETADDVFITLVAAKARVAPLKKITIPRLELLATTIGARLAANILKELGPVGCYFWSDSTTALSWIRREEPWGVFVFNRVKEIRSLTRAEDWHHVPGSMNPADLASRGCSPQTLLESKWWEGPKWLRGPPSEWPSVEIDPDEQQVLEERRKTPIMTTLAQSVSFSSACFNKFSKYSRILRVSAWMYRYIFNRYSKRPKTEGELTVPEIERAEKLILKMVQEESFSGVKDKSLRKLKPKVDPHGLIRLRTKIWARKDSEDFRAPIILPGGHGIVKKLVLEIHKKNGHVVGQNLLSLLRERFWLIRGRQAIKKILAECSICQRHRAKSFEVESPPLPESRVRDANIFEICGVDLAGPLYLMDGSKVWVVLFTCAIYRAVHLEIVTSQSTESFMMAFRRFVALRGRPSIMYSDNGLNFRGTKNALEVVDWNQVAVQGAVDKIEWRFNPPRAAWWGGFWERLVGSVKVILRKTLGRASLTYEELATVIYECATYINQRPLTYVSEDPADPVPITPQMFLCEIPCSGVPDFDAIDSNSLRRKLQRRVHLKEELRRRFRIEYLGQLNFASGGFRDKRSPKVGELVLVGSDLAKRIDWPLAVVEELTLGKDGKCRAVKMRTAHGNLTRAIQHVFPLEIDSANPVTPVQTSESSDDVITPVDDSGFPIQDNSASRDDPAEAAVFDPEMGVQPESETPEMPQDVIVKGKPKRQEKIVLKGCETRCGRKVKLPIKYND